MDRVKVKICGLTNVEDARVAVEAGADLLGFIFYPKSPRYVTPETVAAIIQEIRDWRLESSLPKFVGVFVNETPAQMKAILATTGLDYAQLHGNESTEMMAMLSGCAFKAIRPASAEAAQTGAAQFAELGLADGPSILVDAYDPNLHGGTGKTADWQMAAALARRYPGLLLAGSLTAENVATAIQFVQPWGVDVSSGVEAAPGKKDHDKVRAFVAQAKGLCK